MSKTRILVFIDWFLPGFKAGGPVRSMANMVEHLEQEFEFFIVTRNTEYLETKPYTSVTSNQWNSYSEHVKVFYCSRKFATVNHWNTLIREIRPHKVYINGIYSLKFSLLPLWAARKQKTPEIIIAPRGMLAQSAINVKSSKKKVFLALARLLGLYKSVCWHVTNEKENEEVSKNISTKGIRFVAPNLPRKMNAGFRALAKSPGELRLCALARVAPEKNTLYALERLSEISSDIKVTFHLYGQIYDQAYWELCRQVMDNLPAGVTIEHKGVVVPEKITETIQQYHALFLPSRGENFGHVILESLMAGRPVLISDQTPWLGLKQQNAGWDIPLTQPALFTKTIEQLALMNQAQFDQLCLGSLTLTNRVNNNEDILAAYRKMFAIRPNN